MRCVNVAINYRCIYIVCLSPAPNGSSEMSRFQRGDVIEIRNRITFVFYSGLPHMQTVMFLRFMYS